MSHPIICQLSDFGPEHPGSFVDSLLYLARVCRQTLGLETFCVFPQRARGRRWLERFDKERVKYAFIPAKRNIVLSLRQTLKDFHPLIFHSHFETFDLAPILLKLAFYRDSKIVWHLHSMARLTLHQRIKDAIKVKLLGRRFGDLFITDGDGVYRNAIARGLPNEKLLVNHLGVDLARFSRNMEARQSFRESLAGSKEQKEQTIYLTLGWSPVIKGIDLFLRAAAWMNQNSMSNSLFLIVGTSETREFVSSFPESTRLGTRLRILDPTDDFPRLLNGVDVFVAPSRSEGFAYAVMEAMATGKLIVCSDIPGVREVYGKIEGVWLFPSEDWKQLAELMQMANKLSETERGYLGQANSRFVAEHISLDAWAKKISERVQSRMSRSVLC